MALIVKKKNGRRAPVILAIALLLGALIFTWQQEITEANFVRGGPPLDLAQPKLGWDRVNPLAIPQGQAKNLPSIRVEEVKEGGNVDSKRNIYGGAGDKAHLGGFTELDLQGVSPNVWRHMIQDFNVKSVMDVGCGRGISTSWFFDHGVDILCVEGSHDALHQSVLDHPETQMVEHDFSRGPWWPGKTYDAVWAVEFLEHVGLNFHFNYISTFRKAAVLFGGFSNTKLMAFATVQN
jgi:hypothetical protein